MNKPLADTEVLPVRKLTSLTTPFGFPFEDDDLGDLVAVTAKVLHKLVPGAGVLPALGEQMM